jgi:hypothetical protein
MKPSFLASMQTINSLTQYATLEIGVVVNNSFNLLKLS